MKFPAIAILTLALILALAPLSPAIGQKTFPIRERAIIATKEGYYPQHINIFANEKLRLFLSTTSGKSTCLVLPDFNLFMSAGQGEIDEETILFKRSGTYEFYCPTNKIKGKITVQKRPPHLKDQSTVGRSIASEGEGYQERKREGMGMGVGVGVVDEEESHWRPRPEWNWR